MLGQTYEVQFPFLALQNPPLLCLHIWLSFEGQSNEARMGFCEGKVDALPELRSQTVAVFGSSTLIFDLFRPQN